MRERMGRIMATPWLVPLAEDMRMREYLRPREVRDADEARRVLERNRMDKELARAGIDPRPPRKRGRAVR